MEMKTKTSLIEQQQMNLNNLEKRVRRNRINHVLVILSALLLLILITLNVQAEEDTFKNPQLNLSHVECKDNGVVEVHFVLLNVDEDKYDDVGKVKYWYYFDAVDHTQTYYREVEIEKITGNVIHFTDYVSAGYIDIWQAKVWVDNQYIYLHNPHDYAGDYSECIKPTPTKVVTKEPPTQTPTNTPTNTPTPTATNTNEPTPTETPTVEVVTPTSTPESPTNIEPDIEPNPVPTGNLPQPQERVYLPLIEK